MSAPPRRIGINLLYLVPGQVGGTEIYAHRLLRSLASVRPEARFTVFCGVEAHAALAREEWPEAVELVRLPIRSAVKPLRVAAELGALPAYDARAGIQVLHSVGTTSPRWTRSARVVTIHDLIYEHSPGAFPAAARAGLRAVVPAGARRAHRVIVPSQATKADVVARLGVDPGKVDVVHSGAGMRRVEAPTPEPRLREEWELADRPVVLSVSAALPHKNLDRLLRAFARLPEAGGPAPVLVLVGHAGRAQPELLRLAEDLGIAARIRITGWLSDADLEGLYRLAACFAYPSLYEGFGLPVLEAMEREVPVACSNATSLPEIAGDAAELFDPLDVDAIAEALATTLWDERRRSELRDRGRARAAEFTWTKTAEEVFGCYEVAWRARGSDRQAMTARQ